MKLAQYADANISFLRKTDEVLLFITLLKDFKSVAGVTLHLDKIKALFIADGFKNVRKIALHGLTCTINRAIRCLGVHNQTLCDTLNWEKKY